MIEYTYDAERFAFLDGAPLFVGVALLDDQSPRHRLVDTGTTIAMAGATQAGWDELSTAAAPSPGTYTVTVMTTSGATQTAALDVVAAPDSIEQIATIFSLSACFAANATTPDGPAFVTGLDWTYTLDGSASEPSVFGNNCIDLPYSTTALAVVASAGGQTITVTVPPTEM